MEYSTDIKFEQELLDLGIDYDDCQYLSDGSYGYFIILVSNLDEDQENKLMSHPDYFKLLDDIWCRRLENPTEIPKELLEKILDFKSQKEQAKIKGKCLSKIGQQWQIIVGLKISINESIIDRAGKNAFPATKESELIASKLGNFLAENKEHFKLFCRDIYCYFHEFKSESIKKCKKHKFPRYIEILRHTNIHDDESYYNQNQYVKRVQKKKDIYFDLLGKRHLDDFANFSKDCLELQIQLFNLCIVWLRLIYEDINK